VLSSGEVESLAEIEPRDVLLARLAGGFQAPLVKAAGLFQAFTRNFAYGIKAYVDQRIEGGEALELPAESQAATVEAPTVEASEAEAPAPDTETQTDAAEAPPADETENSTEES